MYTDTHDRISIESTGLTRTDDMAVLIGGTSEKSPKTCTPGFVQPVAIGSLGSRTGGHYLILRC